MIDYCATVEAVAALKKYEAVLQGVLGDAHGMDILKYSGTKAAVKLGKDETQFLKRLPSVDVVQKAKHKLEHVLEDRADEIFMFACLEKELFPRSRYNFDISKKVFLGDVLELQEDGGPVCCVAAYRAIRCISRHESFVPPAGKIVEAVRAEEAGLLSLQSGLVRIAQYISERESRDV